jgi:mono/diheme cytochrome c family protein
MLRTIDRFAAPLVWLVAAAFVVMLLIGPAVVAEDNAQKAAASNYASGGGGKVDGAKVFGANCASCHTLKAAGATGQVGPNLDDSTLPAAEIEATVRDGRGGMPSFGGQLSAAEIKAVAAYVESARR